MSAVDRPARAADLLRDHPGRSVCPVIEGASDRAQAGLRNSIRQVAFASFVGTTVEWYDFFAYGAAAALVFPKLFFPRFDPLAGTLASFATFGVGFCARPNGGAVFTLRLPVAEPLPDRDHHVIGDTDNETGWSPA